MSLLPEPIVSKLVLDNGVTIATYDWLLQTGQKSRGTVLLVHGLGEHIGRYAHVAQHFNQWGFSVKGYDHFGHGLSTGARGGLLTENQLLDDLDAMIVLTRKNMPTNEKLVLVGHSMGGGVVGRYVSLNPNSADALVMSSPAIDGGLNVIQKLLLSILPRVAPNLRVGNGLNPKYISHDTAVVSGYASDPLVHDRISARLAKFIVENGTELIASASRWKMPTLLMFAGQDKLVSPAGSRAFAASAPSCVEVQCFENMYHEIFNEIDQTQVFAYLKTWLDRTLAD
ncbi:MAG TPA: alpha/beta hydrolase [Burkholderiaceae bacterium]|nr:alpha/beta hydrolase [Burkholderiaceae bacterium]